MTFICLPSTPKTRYNCSMPICPQCCSPIHEGAVSCPPCGYGMERADHLFGTEDIEFTRVVDEAGALTHSERIALMSYLENLERRISPVALCVYITDDGRQREFCQHAHWALNHAHIHHPSFGRRQQTATLEEAPLRERLPGEVREEQPKEATEEPDSLSRLWKETRSRLRDLCLPCPPPVQPEWILMLVLDVQLEVACFSWGYMLDPYVSADKINTTIVKARLQFRERAMLTALKKVMAGAVSQMATAARKKNREILRRARKRYNMPSLLATAGLGAALLAPENAQAQAPENAPATEAPAPAAEAPAAEQPAPAPEQPPVVPGSAAAYNAEPRWSSTDYVHLMSGRLPEGYNLLMPEGHQRSTAPEPPQQNLLPVPVQPEDTASTESDTKVPGRYCKPYLDPRGTALRDPQQLLTDIERADVAHVLRELNAHSRFHIYVSVFRAGQEVPRELTATNLVTNVAQPGQYTAMLQYGTGEPATIELGYKEIAPGDERLREWQDTVRRSVAAAGGGVEGLLAGIRSLHACIQPMEEGFVPLTPETSGSVRKIQIPLQPPPKQEERSWRDDAKEWVLSGQGIPYLILGTAGLILAGLAGWAIYWFRSCCRLYATEPDYRLGSRYGAGVSRYVRYLEGVTEKKEVNAV